MANNAAKKREGGKIRERGLLSLSLRMGGGPPTKGEKKAGTAPLIFSPLLPLGIFEIRGGEGS